MCTVTLHWVHHKILLFLQRFSTSIWLVVAVHSLPFLDRPISNKLSKNYLRYVFAGTFYSDYGSFRFIFDHTLSNLILRKLLNRRNMQNKNLTSCFKFSGGMLYETLLSMLVVSECVYFFTNFTLVVLYCDCL